MYYQGKLKSDSSITGFIPAILCLLIAFAAGIVFEPRVGFLSVALFFGFYGLFSMFIYSRTKNTGYLAASIWQFLIGIQIASCPQVGYIRFSNRITEAFFYLFLGMVTAWLLFLFFSRRAKWKGREVFELAAMPVNTALNGFTERPLFTGKTDYTVAELKRFANFLKKNLVAMPFFNADSIVFVPVRMGDEFSYIFNPFRFKMNRTWIAFDYQGNVSVNISKKDYLEFREELTFDQLCSQLGRLFIEFLDLYKKGEAGRIIFRLDEIKTGLTT